LLRRLLYLPWATPAVALATFLAAPAAAQETGLEGGFPQVPVLSVAIDRAALPPPLGGSTTGGGHAQVAPLSPAAREEIAAALADAVHARWPELGRLDVRPAFADWSPPTETPPVSASGAGRTRPDLSRFFHVACRDFREVELARAALEAQPWVHLAQLMPAPPVSSEVPDDPFFDQSPWFSRDSQWPQRNSGARGPLERCGAAVAGADLRVVPVWKKILDGAYGNLPGLGDPTVVLGLLDQGIPDQHPELRVLREFSDDPRINRCPGRDWCGDHGAKMAGLAGMATNNGAGAAGVCGDCSLLDILGTHCACEFCENEEHLCALMSPFWVEQFAGAVALPLGADETGQPRTLSVINAAFAQIGYAPLEQVEAVWDAYLRGTLFVASSSDRSLSHPIPLIPAGMPLVLGVGGSTWEDRFWDQSHSCYAGIWGTTLGPGAIDVTAPASGRMLSAYPVDNPGGGGPYAITSGQCSGASALVTGTAGLLQSLAAALARAGQPTSTRDSSIPDPGRPDRLSPDDLAGLITASTRSFAADPTFDATCPVSECPRSYYGTGIVSVENAAFVLLHARDWSVRTVTLADGCTREAIGDRFQDTRGRTWQAWRVAWTGQCAPRPQAADAPADLPAYIAWALPAASTSLCNYGLPSQRAFYAEAGIPECVLELDREDGRFELSGWNFVEIRGGEEIPLVPWDEVRMCYTTWEDRATASPAAGATGIHRGGELGRPELEIMVNPFRGRLDSRIMIPRGGAGVLEILDPLGRQVRVLRQGWFAAGPGLISWDARLADGRAAANGLYWLRLTWEGRTVVRPAVLVK